MLLRVGDLHYCLNGSTLNYELAINKPYILNCWHHFYLFLAHYHWDYFLIHYFWPFLAPELRWSSDRLIFLSGPFLKIIHDYTMMRKYFLWFHEKFNYLRVSKIDLALILTLCLFVFWLSFRHMSQIEI